MKSYTDIEQSKKLAEFLPVESADMAWCNHSIRGVNYTDEYSANLYTVKEMKEFFDNAFNGWDKYWKLIPCWSLAALLDVLPTYLFEFDRGIDLNVYPNLNGRGWHCSYMPNCIENIKTDKFKLITSEDTLVDACYEMILKLNELKLL